MVESGVDSGVGRYPGEIGGERPLGRRGHPVDGTDLGRFVQAPYPGVDVDYRVAVAVTDRVVPDRIPSRSA